MPKKHRSVHKIQIIHHKRRSRYRFKRYFLLAILFVGLVFTGIYLKKKLYFYYQMYYGKSSHQHLSNTAYENQRIKRIITENQDKIFGFDISHYQHHEDIRWDSLWIANGTIKLDFVVMRATMGNSKKDKHFKTFWKAAKEHQITRGAYHFYRADEDPIVQANNYLETILLEEGDLRPVLDIEKIPRKKSRKRLIEDLKTWLNIVEEKYGKKPIIYTYYHYYKDYLRDDFEDYPLWLANYNDVSQPSDEDHWKLWQFTENGIVSGINSKVDLNVYNGNAWSFNYLLVK